MKLLSFVSIAVLALPLGAFAQPAPPAPAVAAPDLRAFLERRVTEELASDGILLSRLGVALEVELIGEHALVSLVDQTTRHASASTKVDAMPPDREAAVAMITQVAANLAVQLGAGPVRPPAAAPINERPDRAQREQAELRFKQEAIGFGEDLGVVSLGNGNITTTRHWYISRGELKVRLEPKRFYELVGRPDLAKAYQARSSRSTHYTIATLALWAIGGAAAIKYASMDADTSSCAFDDFACRSRIRDRVEADGQKYVIAASVGIVAGSVTMFLAMHYAFHPHPITETEAKGLANDYNNRLRHDLGLPTASRRAPRRLKDVAWTPYSSADGGGLAVMGRF